MKCDSVFAYFGHCINIVYYNFGGDGIQSVFSSTEGEEMVNGKWSNEKCYDLSGRRVNPSKAEGLVIKRLPDGRVVKQLR